MKIDDCALLMTKIFLSRIVDSIIKETIPRGDEDRLRQQIAQNRAGLASEDRIREALSEIAVNRESRIVVDAVLTTLLSSPDMACAPDELFDAVLGFEQQIVEDAADERCLSFSCAKSVDIYGAVLEVALEDNEITPDEFALLEKLRKKLGISRVEHRLMEARLGNSPNPAISFTASMSSKKRSRSCSWSGSSSTATARRTADSWCCQTRLPSA